MAWVNLNDVYVNKAGGTITGDLEVDGNLTINDATGNGTTYNVANEISTLRDSVSQDTGLIYLYKNDKYGTVSYRAKNGVCTLYVCGVYGIAAGSSWGVSKQIPTQYLPDVAAYCPLAYRQSNNIGNVWVPSKSSSDQKLYIYATIACDSSNIALNGFVSWAY